METTNFEAQNPIPDIEIPVLPSTPTPNKNIFKTLFFIFLGLFLIISSIYFYLWVKSDQLSQNSQTEIKNQSINNINSTPSPTSAQAIINNQNSLKQVLTDWSLYREIENKDQFFYETDQDGTRKTCGSWFCNVPSNHELYPFTQKILNGSIKELTIGIRSVYITPNYENYNNQEFNNLNIGSFSTGIIEIQPLYVYDDKLIWSTLPGCGGAIPDTQIDKENYASCEYLEKLISTAFEQ
ncbi:MAG: hypothetical protein PHP97_04470 [Candidatus Shapirobacteria bacterium]|nr:hypothetical protein [Candidatus Shapirobacteria bacterium]MDD3002566.1 hypothetical protein [Candidatus Shapirobacteria bacterium]MDD4383065.1 hypothetical protein [Candidatus Shapirobacteria bacterium]